MNKDAIRNTAVCRWDAREKCFIVQSPLYDVLIGAADTEFAAWQIFDDFLDDAYTSYLEGRLGGMYAKRGRPPKNRAGIHCEVKPETRDDLRALAADLGCSQGETIDYLTAFLKAAKTAKSDGGLVGSGRKRKVVARSHSPVSSKRTAKRRKAVEGSTF